MVRRVFLHVGLSKSGTTYLQAVLDGNRTVLQERAGLLFPLTWAQQVDAVRDLRGFPVPTVRRAVVRGAWERLTTEVSSWSGDALVSMEWLAAAAPDEIDRIAADLAGLEPHVVFTVRDLARTVPAVWQESTQNTSTWRWAEYLEQVASEDPRSTAAGEHFWGQQDMADMLERWSRLTWPGHIHVVTVPRPGSDPGQLWRRLASVVGLAPDGYDLAPARRNASLGLESAELMRLVNEQARARDVRGLDYERAFKHPLAKGILAARQREESRVRLPAGLHDWAHEQAERQIEAIKMSGADVVGSLEELRPCLDGSAAAPSEPEASGVLGAAVDALTTVSLARLEVGQEMRRVQAELAHALRANEELRAEIERRTSRPVRQALVDLSERRPALRRARVAYRTAVDAGRRLRRST